MNNLLTKDQLAAKLKLTVGDIDKLKKKGLRTVGDTGMFSWYQVKKWLKREGLL